MPVSSQTAVTVELYFQAVFQLVIDVDGAWQYPDGEKWQNWIQTWFNSLREDLPDADAYELTLRLTDDQEIKQLNSQFRQQEKPTDVLSFAALEADLPDYHDFQSDDQVREALYLGDIVISLETASQQAIEHCHSLIIELAWLATHGLLHLLGWDHPDDQSLNTMLAKQALLLEQVGLVANFES
jgi:probable rRNA maturation factor